MQNKSVESIALTILAFLRLKVGIDVNEHTIPRIAKEIELYASQNNNKNRLSESFVKGILSEYIQEKISFSKMVELFNQQTFSQTRFPETIDEVKEYEKTGQLPLSSISSPNKKEAVQLDRFHEWLNDNRWDWTSTTAGIFMWFQRISSNGLIPSDQHGKTTSQLYDIYTKQN